MLAELLPGWPDLCLAAINLYYVSSAEGGGKDCCGIRKGKALKQKLFLLWILDAF